MNTWVVRAAFLDIVEVRVFEEGVIIELVAAPAIFDGLSG